GAMTIAFRCDFASAGDWIEIGAIGIRLAMSPTPVSDDEIASRHGARLDQNRPNPFNPSTAIRFDLPREQRVEVTVYTIDGKRVATLHDGFLGEGRHEMVWGGRDDRGRPQASGVYLYRLKTDDGMESRRMTLVR
ncbi:T9SS type A sorting domain-containing protein, partial [bacterium]|nr:T9SS type A sorting domain-containing protein [bacterium]